MIPVQLSPVMLYEQSQRVSQLVTAGQSAQVDQEIDTGAPDRVIAVEQPIATLGLTLFYQISVRKPSL